MKMPWSALWMCVQGGDIVQLSSPYVTLSDISWSFSKEPGSQFWSYKYNEDKSIKWK
jgi:hypothetical protein